MIDFSQTFDNGGTMTKVRASIVDYAVGNVQSVLYACRKVSIEATITDKPEHIKDSDLVILPGVGSFPKAANTLREKGLADELVAHAQNGKPFLGICLGMQLLFDSSDEHGGDTGLGLLRGEVRPLKRAGENDKLPNVGWRPVNLRAGSESSPFQNHSDTDSFYFFHSYQAKPQVSDVTAATSFYGGELICAAVASENIVGCQFHPERSGRAGLEFYARLRSWCLNF